jgi:4-carboxymuconolactone decarboxylase
MTERERLFARYDNAALENGLRLKGEAFLGTVASLDALDPEWTQAWLNWIYGDCYRREVIDDRTRELVAVGVHTVLGNASHLPRHIGSALRVGARPEEVLEVILQSSIYNGLPKSLVAAEVWRDEMEQRGQRRGRDAGDT